MLQKLKKRWRAAVDALLIPNWRRLWRAWSVQVAALGLLLPELLGLIADNSHSLPWVDEEVKAAIRIGCLVAVPLLRVIQQRPLQ